MIKSRHFYENKYHIVGLWRRGTQKETTTVYRLSASILKDGQFPLLGDMILLRAQLKLNLFEFIYILKQNTTGKEIANWNVMFGTVAIQMSILDTNFPRFCLANIWTGSNLSVTATWSPKVTYRIYFQLSGRGQEATLDRTVVFVILICVFF